MEGRSTAARALGGVPVVSFDSRRPRTLARLFARHGASVLRAAAARDVTVPSSPAAETLVRHLRERTLEVIVLSSGLGARTLAAAVRPLAPDFPALLERTSVVACDSEGFAAATEMGVRTVRRVPPPHTWREVLALLDALPLPTTARVAVQEYGQEPAALHLGLLARGHEVLRVPVFRFALPDDLEPLRRGIEAICTRQARIAVFTSPVQVEHLFRIAPDPESLRRALDDMIVAALGPTCSEALAAHGIRPAVEADRPDLAPFADLVADRAPALLCRR